MPVVTIIVMMLHIKHLVTIHFTDLILTVRSNVCLTTQFPAHSLFHLNNAGIGILGFNIPLDTVSTQYRSFRRQGL